MNFELLVYPKRGTILKGTADQFLKLLEKGVLEEMEDGTARFVGEVKLSVVNEGAESLEKFVTEQWIPLFPTQEIKSGSASYRVTGNKKEIVRYMKDFLKQYKTRFDYDCIFISTAAYLYDKSLVNFDYTSKCHNFIRRELEAWCLAYEQDPSKLFQKAKLYYEYVRRTAARTRKKRVDAAGFGRSAILRQPDAGIPKLGAGGDGGGRRGDNGGGSNRRQSESGHIRPSIPIELRSGAIRINSSHKKGAGNKGGTS